MKAFNIVFKEKLEQIIENIETIELKRKEQYEIKIKLNNGITINYEKETITITNKDKITTYHEDFTTQGMNIENYTEYKKDKELISKIYSGIIKDMTRTLAEKETIQEAIFREIRKIRNYTTKEPKRILEELINN